MFFSWCLNSHFSEPTGLNNSINVPFDNFFQQKSMSFWTYFDVWSSSFFFPFHGKKQLDCASSSREWHDLILMFAYFWFFKNRFFSFHRLCNLQHLFFDCLYLQDNWLNRFISGCQSTVEDPASLSFKKIFILLFCWANKFWKLEVFPEFIALCHLKVHPFNFGSAHWKPSIHLTLAMLD